MVIKRKAVVDMLHTLVKKIMHVSCFGFLMITVAYDVFAALEPKQSLFRTDGLEFPEDQECNFVGMRCEFDGFIEIMIHRSIYEKMYYRANYWQRKDSRRLYDQPRLTKGCGVFMERVGEWYTLGLNNGQCVWFPKDMKSFRIRLFPCGDLKFYNVFAGPLHVKTAVNTQARSLLHECFIGSRSNCDYYLVNPGKELHLPAGVLHKLELYPHNN
jgi:hypothetical protein